MQGLRDRRKQAVKTVEYLLIPKRVTVQRRESQTRRSLGKEVKLHIRTNALCPDKRPKTLQSRNEELAPHCNQIIKHAGIRPHIPREHFFTTASQEIARRSSRIVPVVSKLRLDRLRPIGRPFETVASRCGGGTQQD